MKNITISPKSDAKITNQNYFKWSEYFMSDRVNQPKWNIQGSRVYGNGFSYNLTSRIDAERLVTTLNKYETEITNLSKQNTTSRNIEAIDKQLKQVLMDMEILKHDIDVLKDKLEV